MRRLVFALLLLVAAAAPAFAVDPGEKLADPALEARARAISQELRCLVCQNQSIDDSNADLARDLRRIVRERLVAGDSDKEVVGYIVARYGEFVLLRPRFEAATWLLWLGPALALLMGGGVILALFRRKGATAPAALDSAETERLKRILGETESPTPHR
ncbi:MAG TPA: cytochrome c-type biogenesis protein [Parvibaculum sp.]